MLYLREIRNSAGKTQQEVADYLKVARVTYTNIENGKRDPDTQTILALADFFSVSLDEIFGRASKTPAPIETFSAEEVELIHYFRNINSESRKVVMDLVKTYAESPAKQEGLIQRDAT